MKIFYFWVKVSISLRSNKEVQFEGISFNNIGSVNVQY